MFAKTSSSLYDTEVKHISVHSEDIDTIQYPNTAQFSIRLPQELNNIQSVRLASWSFPSNYDTFDTLFAGNTLMTFRIHAPYDAPTHNPTNDLQVAIYQALMAHADEPFLIQIESGFYNPSQMMFELMNKMNRTVSFYIDDYFASNSITTTIPFTGYYEFVVVYDAVGQQMWFGNRSDQFILTNETTVELIKGSELRCLLGRRQLPNYSQYGLPSFLGLPRVDMQAESPSVWSSILSPNYLANYANLTQEQVSVIPMVKCLDYLDGALVPRFFYGDIFAGDTGFWLFPDLVTKPNSEVFYTKAPSKINFLGEAYFYMEIENLNCLDETKPFNYVEGVETKVKQCVASKATTAPSRCANVTGGHVNPHNGVVNAAFAKIPVCAAPISRWIDRRADTEKVFNPPNATLRELRVKFRYHDGTLVNFGTFNYSFSLEVTMVKPKSG